jgi:hypothetical protein
MAMLKVTSAEQAERIEAGFMVCTVHPIRRNVIHAGDALHLFLQQAGRSDQRLYPNAAVGTRPAHAPLAVQCTAVMPLALVLAPPQKQEGWYIAASLSPRRDYPVITLDLLELLTLIGRAGWNGEGTAPRDAFAAHHYQRAQGAPGHLPNTGICQLEVIWWDDPAKCGFTAEWWNRKRASAGGAPMPDPPRPLVFHRGDTAIERGDALTAWRKQHRARGSRPRVKTRPPTPVQKPPVTPTAHRG